MEFLVRLTPDLPASFDDEATDALYVQERARGAELMRQGRILRAWRLQDAKGGLLLFDATDTSHLQDLLESLPIYA